MRILFTAAQTFFDEAWRRCEAEGWCDGHGGAEYDRILSAWIAADMPFDVWTFIRKRGSLVCKVKGGAS